MPKLERSISTISPATVPDKTETREGEGSRGGVGKRLGEGEGDGEGVGVGVGDGEGEGEGLGEGVGVEAVRLISKVFDSPAGLVELPVKRRTFTS